MPLETNTVRQRVVGGDFEAAFIQFTATRSRSRDVARTSGSARAARISGTRAENAGDRLGAPDRRADGAGRRRPSTKQERKRLFNEVQRIFAENLPMLYFAAPRVYFGASARLMNLQPALTRPQLMWSADTLAVKRAGTHALTAMSFGRYLLRRVLLRAAARLRRLVRRAAS